jgi:fructosamine-3-kinase
MLEGILIDGEEAGVSLPIPHHEFLPQINSHLQVLEEVTQPALVHWDLWDGNIFIDPESKHITGILDCERALWGDPLMEVNFGAFGSNPAVIKGYGVDLTASPSAGTRRSLYNLYLWLIMTIECTYRQFETKDQENWARTKLIAELKILGIRL